MKGFVDIHTHMIPGVDDGAGTMETAVQMIRLSEEQGVNHIICTSHFDSGHYMPNTDRLKGYVAAMQEYLERKNIPVRLYTGNEIYYNIDVPVYLEQGRVLPLAETSYVLLEFGTNTPYRNIRISVQNLVNAGYRPVIAHAERYESLAKHIACVEELIYLGAYIQVNAASVYDSNAKKKKKFTAKLLQQEMVHFIASDAHNLNDRRPNLGMCSEYLEKKYGAEKRDRLLIRNPGILLKNDYLDTSM